MFKSSGQPEAPNPETGASGELQAIVGWLRALPGEEIRELREALCNHDAAHLAGYVARFQNYPESST